MGTVAIVCNGCEPQNLFPTFIMGSAAAAMGDEVVLFFTPRRRLPWWRAAWKRCRPRGCPPWRNWSPTFRIWRAGS